MSFLCILSLGHEESRHCWQKHDRTTEGREGCTGVEQKPLCGASVLLVSIRNESFPGNLWHWHLSCTNLLLAALTPVCTTLPLFIFNIAHTGNGIPHWWWCQIAPSHLWILWTGYVREIYFRGCTGFRLSTPSWHNPPVGLIKTCVMTFVFSALCV